MPSPASSGQGTQRAYAGSSARQAGLACTVSSSTAPNRTVLTLVFDTTDVKVATSV